MENSQIYEELQDKVNILCQTAWYDRKLTWPQVEKWLEQFSNESSVNQLQLLFLLSHFIYFGRREIREMLKALYRDLYKYPIIESIRKENNHTKNRKLINDTFEDKLNKTRFLGIGNPSESGTHLLYFFRQENKLSKDLFINGHQLYNRLDDGQITIKEPDIEHYVFIDDLSGSGTQAKEYSKTLVKVLKSLNPQIRVSYFTLFCTNEAKKEIKKRTLFDHVECVFELDDSFKCFSNSSRYYEGELPPFDREKTKALCLKYDKSIMPSFVLGYKSSQLLLGFYHNTPDNVPPIFWYEGDHIKPWYPIFTRYHKIY